MIFFLLKIRRHIHSGPARYIRISFLRPRFFKANFKNFLSKTTLDFSENERFCEHRGLLGVFGTMRLTIDKRFSVEQNGFFVVSSWEKRFSSIMRIPFEYFWHCKIDRILTIASFCIFKSFNFSNLELSADLAVPSSCNI